MSKPYQIPFGSLHNRFNGKHGTKPGGQTMFSNEEEKQMTAAVTKYREWGFPLTLMDLRLVLKNVCSYCKTFEINSNLIVLE